MLTLDEQIAELDVDALKKWIDTADVVPRGYQWLATKLTGEAIRNKKYPAYLNVSVGGGKSLLIAMIAKRFQQMSQAGIQAEAKRRGISPLLVRGEWQGIILARQGEICNQDATECWNLQVKNSLFSASLGAKSTEYDIIVGSEGTICNALNGKLKDYVPRWMLIDECHQVDDEDLSSDGKKKQYTEIIQEFQKRCQAKYNTDIIIIGYTGSPMRGRTPLKGDFWKEEIIDVSTDYLVQHGFLVPTIFGTSELKYDLHEFSADGEDGTDDFTQSQLSEMAKRIAEQKTMTQQIMNEVIALTKNRNGVLITCASKEHCLEVASCIPAEAGRYAVVTESMGQGERIKVLAEAYNGKYKFILQIGCLTTGVNIPYWDTSVILRKIRSLTLLIQLLGRGMRLDAARGKEDHLVLCYTDTMDELGDMYYDPILERAKYQRDMRDKNTVTCPCCGSKNSERAIRCIGANEGNQCEYFFKSTICEKRQIGNRIIEGCGTENAPSARKCRKCGDQLIDPNDNLIRNHYKEGDYLPVQSFNVRPTRDCQGVIMEYGIMHNCKPYTAREVIYFGQNPRAMKAKIAKHVIDKNAKSMIFRSKNAIDVMQAKEYIMSPALITHRVNGAGRDLITKKIFNYEL